MDASEKVCMNQFIVLFIYILLGYIGYFRR